VSRRNLALRSLVEMSLFHAVGAAVRALPSVRVYAVVGAISSRWFRFGPRHARWAMVNLRIAFPELPDAALREIGARSYTNLAWDALDLLYAETWNAPELGQHVSIRGLEHLEAALARGKGVLLMALHLGNFELSARALAQRGIPVAAVARPFGSPALWQHIVRRREQWGVRVFDRDGAARQMLRALRKGTVVCVLNDQYARGAGAVSARLFGLRARTWAGIATLSLRTGTPVVPAYPVRDGLDHHTLYLDPAVEPLAPTGDRRADVLALTERYNAVIEALVRKYPEHWTWINRRFRNSPDLEDKNPYR
jgi:KDO2-lipid IV(A) lauroyltransferase